MRRAIQASEEKNTVLAKQYGVNRKTIAKWKAREFTSDERMGPKNPSSSVLTQVDELIILVYRWRTRLPLNDCLERLRPTDRAIGLIDRFAACFRDAVAVFGGGERIVADPPVDLRERALLRGRTRRY